MRIRKYPASENQDYGGHTVPIPQDGGGGGGVATKDEGSTVDASAATIDFVGAGVTATGGFGTTTVTIPGGATSPLTTKGDLWGYDTGNARVPVGSNNQVLMADSAQTLGVKWVSPSQVGGWVAYNQVVVSGSPGTVTFAIPSGFTDFRILAKSRDTGNSSISYNAFLHLNNDTTTANYNTSHVIAAASPTGVAGSGVNATSQGAYFGSVAGTLNNANSITIIDLVFPCYADGFYKLFYCNTSTFYDTSFSRRAIVWTTGQYLSTSAITDITFNAPDTAWVNGSIWTLYMGGGP